jgi:hypothetical protein
MDIVQRDAERQRLIERDTPSIWAGFRSALEALITSYQATPRKSGWTAETDRVHDRSLVVTQHRGVAPDGWHEVVLITTVVLDESLHAIVAGCELLFTRAGVSSVRSTFSYRYAIDAAVPAAELSDSPVTKASLMIDNGPVSSLQAAEDLVSKTLLHAFSV